MKIVTTLVVNPGNARHLADACQAALTAVENAGGRPSDIVTLSEVANDLYFQVNDKSAAIAVRKQAEILDRLPIDHICQRTDHRAKSLLLADMDSTIIGVECIDELARIAGCLDEVAEITDAAMRGELVFEESLARRVALLRGLPEQALHTVFRDRITYNPGAETLIKTLGSRGIRTILVSGGFTFFTGRVAQALGFTDHRANRLEIDRGQLTGHIIPPVLGATAKEQALSEYLQKFGISGTRAVCVGDGANDAAMLKAAGLAVSYYGKKPAEAVADLRIRHTDLTTILYALGIPSASFVADTTRQ